MTGAQPSAGATRYELDKSASRFTVRAFAGGLLSALGHNPTIAIRNFTGEASLDPVNPGLASLRLEIQADSLEVTDDVSSNDRREMESAMKDKVLEVSKYPTILFDGHGTSATQLGEGRYRIQLSGDLSLHGVTRKVPVTVQAAIYGVMLRGSGEFSILQTDFGITLVSVAGGTLKIRDELKFAFDMVARKDVPAEA